MQGDDAGLIAKLQWTIVFCPSCTWSLVVRGSSFPAASSGCPQQQCSFLQYDQLARICSIQFAYHDPQLQYHAVVRIGLRAAAASPKEDSSLSSRADNVFSISKTVSWPLLVDNVAAILWAPTSSATVAAFTSCLTPGRRYDCISSVVVTASSTVFGSLCLTANATWELSSSPRYLYRASNSFAFSSSSGKAFSARTRSSSAKSLQDSSRLRLLA